MLADADSGDASEYAMLTGRPLPRQRLLGSAYAIARAQPLHVPLLAHFTTASARLFQPRSFHRYHN